MRHTLAFAVVLAASVAAGALASIVTLTVLDEDGLPVSDAQVTL